MRTKNGQIFGDLQNQLKILDEINGILYKNPTSILLVMKRF